jgi:RNA polymerase sigma-70 factor (ECF subfamily)
MTMVTQQPGQTVNSSGADDERQFTVMYQGHYADVVRYGYRRLGDLDASAELAQDVFLVAWRRRARVPAHSLPWLYGVARRLLANQWRARRKEAGDVPLGDVDHLVAARPGSVSDAAATRADLSLALAQLSEREREVLRLVVWEQLTTAELAVALGTSQTTAKVRLHRARRRLAAAMTDTTGSNRRTT